MATINYCNYEIKGTLTTTGAITSGGTITAPGGNSSQWNTGYANSITGFSDSGSSTITLTLTQQDGGTLSTSFSNPQGTVTSVGFSHAGNAFTTGGAPVTSSGTIAITMAGSSSQYINGAGNLVTFPSIPQGDITGITVGTGLDGGGTSGNVSITLDLDELASGGTLVGADSLVAVNGGVQNKQTISSIPLSIFNNNSGFVTSSGVTSVGLAVANADSLQITNSPVTSTGNLTINFQGDTNEYINGEGDLITFPSIPQGDITAVVAGTGLSGGGTSGSVTLNNTITNNNQLTNGAGYITASSTNTLTNKGGNISQWTNNSGYITSASLPTVNNASISITTAAGLDGAAIFTTNQSFNETISLSLDLSELTDMTAGMTATDEFIVLDSSAERRKAAGEIGLSIFNNNAGFITSASLPTVGNATITIAAGNKLTGTANFTTNQTSNETITLGLASNNVSQFTNDSGYTTNIGDITGVTAGTNLTGGGTSGTVTLNMATGGVGSGTYGSTSNSTKIDTISVDAYGRVTAVATGATGQVNTINSGNANTLTKSGSTTVTLTPNTGTVNLSSSNLATGAQIQTAINTALTGVLQFEGTWNASTNSPALASNVGTSGDYYIVAVAGSTNLNGITDWQVGDWAVFANTTWTKVDNTAVGSMSSWTLKEGNGTETSTVTNGETVTFAQGAGIQTELTSTSSGGTLTISNTITNNTQLTNGRGFTTNTGTVTTSGTINTNEFARFASSTAIQALTAAEMRTALNVPNTTTVITNNNQLTNGRGFTTNTGTTTASNTQTFTNKSGNISQWSNNSGYINSGSVAILSNGSTPSLGSGITAAEVRNLIGAGTSSSSGVTSVSVSAGTGISASVASSTTTPTISITNTAPNIVQTTITGNAGTATKFSTGRTNYKGVTDTSVIGMMMWKNYGNNHTIFDASASTSPSGSSISNTNPGAAWTGTYPTLMGWNGSQTYGVRVDISRKAEVLNTSRTIAGVAFNGSANISLNNNAISNGAGYTTNTGTTTPSNTQTFTNKSGNISQWTNDSGYVTSSGGSMSTWNLTADSGGTESISNGETVDIAGGSNITTSRSGSTITINNGITNNTQISNGRGFTTNTGTTTASNTQTFTNKSGNISQWNNNSGYTTNVGDITAVVAGNKLTGGGTSGSVTLGLASNNISQFTNDSGYSTSNYSQWIVQADSGSVLNVTSGTNVDFVGGTNISTSTGTQSGGLKVTITNGITNNNQLTNGAGYTTSVGDITAVIAGTGLSGGGSSGSVTLNNTITNNNQLTNGAGYITSFTNNYVTGGNVTSGFVTLNRTGLSNVSFAISNSQIANGRGFVTSSGVTSVATSSPILGGTITSTGTISLLKPVSGNWHNASPPQVGTDGLMEVGRYIDFHTSNTSTSDFDCRLDCNGSQLQLTGNFKATSNIIANGRMQVASSSTSAFFTVGATANNVATNIIHASDTAFRFTTKLGSASSNQPIFRQGTYYNNTENSSIAYYRGGSTTGGFLTFQTNNGSERMRIDSGGQVGINTTAPSATLHLKAIASNGVPFKLEAHPSTTVSQFLIFATKAYNSSSSWFNLVCQAGNGSGGALNTLIIERDGDVKNLNNTYGQISDERLKENIKDATPKLDDLMKVKVKNFNFIGHELKQIGVVAQELEEVFPGLVKEDVQPEDSLGEGGVFKSVKYSILVPILVKAMQEQQVMIEDLKRRVDNLEK